MNPNVIVKGLGENTETDVLIDIGSELILPAVKRKLKPATFCLVIANGKKFQYNRRIYFPPTFSDS